MSGDSKKKVSPLWHFMRSMEIKPPPPRAAQGDLLPSREITEDDLRPLREEAHWRPSAILDRLGPSPKDEQYLGYLLVACAVIQGPHRLHEINERLRSMMIAYLPRLKLMRNDENLRSRRKEIDHLVKHVNTGLQELVQTRARAANDMEQMVLKPDGLRVLDLVILTSQIQNIVEAHEIVQRRNVTGLDFGLAVARQRPDMRTAEDWLDRLMGNSELNGILLFWPQSYGRVVVVYDDGRLAYDPGAQVEEEPG